MSDSKSKELQPASLSSRLAPLVAEWQKAARFRAILTALGAIARLGNASANAQATDFPVMRAGRAKTRTVHTDADVMVLVRDPRPTIQEPRYCSNSLKPRMPKRIWLGHYATA